jgi:purine-nucleoside phosphorylase
MSYDTKDLFMILPSKNCSNCKFSDYVREEEQYPSHDTKLVFTCLNEGSTKGLETHVTNCCSEHTFKNNVIQENCCSICSYNLSSYVVSCAIHKDVLLTESNVCGYFKLLKNL